MATVLEIITGCLTSIGVVARGHAAESYDVDNAIFVLNGLIDESGSYMAPATTELTTTTTAAKSVLKFSSTAGGAEFIAPRVPSEVLALHYLNGSDWMPILRMDLRSAANAIASTTAAPAPVPWWFCVVPGTGNNGAATFAEIHFAQPVNAATFRAVVQSLPGNLSRTDSWPFVGNLSSYLMHRLRGLICPEYGKDPALWMQQSEACLARMRMQSGTMLGNVPAADDVQQGRGLGFL